MKGVAATMFEESLKILGKMNIFYIHQGSAHKEF